jgi:hypothetical protein
MPSGYFMYLQLQHPSILPSAHTVYSYALYGSQRNKTNNVRINVTLRRVRAAIAAVEKP